MGNIGKLIAWGLVGAACFSTSFVLYELMSVKGGHWFWSASLRCLFMWLLLTLFILIQQRFQWQTLQQLWQLFWRNWQFWCLAGAIGFGTYGLLAFAADYAAGWVIAATYLFTVVASLFVLAFFGQQFHRRVIIFSLIIFVGVVLANVGEGLRHSAATNIHATDPTWHTMLWYGALPASIASFCFPIGNQLVWQAAQAKSSASAQPASSFRQTLLMALPYIDSPLLANPLHKVWLMSLGSLPMWALLTFILRPPMPSLSQVSTSFLVALSAGVIGTTVFLYARSQANSSQQIAAVDATQGSEIIFALLGGMLLLQTPLPTMLSFIGIILVIIGLVLFAKYS